MKQRRLIFWSILSIIVVFAGIGVYSVYHKFQDHVLEYIGMQDSNVDVEWGKIRYFKKKGKQGVVVSDFVTYNKATRDSVFSADKIVFYLSERLSKVKSSESVLLFVDNPKVHLYETEPTSVDSISQDLTVFSFLDMPSVYIKNLQFVNHIQSVEMPLINGVDLKGKNKGDKYEIKVRLSDSVKSNSYVLSAQLAGNSKNVRVDSAYLSYNDYRFLFFDLHMQFHNLSKPDYQYHIYNHQQGKSCLPIVDLTNDSFIDFDVFYRNWDGEIQAYTNADLQITTTQGFQIKYHKQSHSIPENIGDTCLLELKNGFQEYVYSKKVNHVDSVLEFSQLAKGNISTRLLISDSSSCEFQLKSDFNQQFINNNYQRNGFIANDMQLKLFDQEFAVLHFVNKKRNELVIENENINGSVKFRNLMTELLNEKDIYCFSDFVVNKINIPTYHTDASPEFFNNRKTKRDAPEWFKTLHAGIKLSVDSLFVDSVVFAQNLVLEAKTENEKLFAQTYLSFIGENSGDIGADINSYNHNISGRIYSSGMQLINQKQMPILSANFKADNDTAFVFPFAINFATDKNGCVLVPRSSIKTKEFKFSVSGLLCPENIDLQVGLTAPGHKFTGPAEMVLLQKSGRGFGVKTVELYVHREDGKLRLRTDVKED